MTGRSGSTAAACWRPTWMVGLILSCWVGAVLGQGQRDPTVAPAAAGIGAAAQGAEAGRSEIGAEAIIVRDGRLQLVNGSRVYSRGQKIGAARIERISETEIWLREGGVLRKVARFPGVEISVASRTKHTFKAPVVPVPNREVHPNDKKSPRHD